HFSPDMFVPWVGERYASQQEYPRTLILGESHYGAHHTGLGYKVEEKTILCIKDQIENNCPYRFFTKLVSTVIGRRPVLEDKCHFWHSIVYHNLIVEPLAGPRQCPSPDLWKRSLLTLPAVFEAHRPELCIALGFRLWRELRG